MRKDYLPVDDAAGSLAEAALVERFWTDQWRDRARPAGVSDVPKREEYAVIAPFLGRLSPGSRILDGGCGMGEWTVFLAARGFDVVGADISEHTVRRLKEWFPQRAFVHADLRATTFEPASFDAYFSWGTFEHFENGLGGCLSEAYRILKAGGWLFVSVPFHNWRLMLGDRKALEQTDPGFKPGTGYVHHQRFYQWRLTRPELRRELEMHGFDVQQITPIGKGTGAGRLLRRLAPSVERGSLPYRVATRALTMTLPAAYLSHMILAVGRKRRA